MGSISQSNPIIIEDQVHAPRCLNGLYLNTFLDESCASYVDVARRAWPANSPTAS